MVLQLRNHHPSLYRYNCLVIEPYRRYFGPNRDRLICRCHFCYSSGSSLLCCREHRRRRLSLRRPYNMFGYPLLTLCLIVMIRGVSGEKLQESRTISLYLKCSFSTARKSSVMVQTQSPGVPYNGRARKIGEGAKQKRYSPFLVLRLT